MGSDQPLERPDHLAVTPECELGGDRGLLGHGPELVETVDRRPCEVGWPQVGQHRPAPERQGRTQESSCLVRLLQGQRLLTTVDPVLEDLGVQVVGVQPQRIPTAAGHERFAGTRRRQGPPYGADVGAERDRRTGAGRLAPERGHEPVGAQRLVEVEQEHGQQLAGSPSAQGDRETVRTYEL